MLVFTLGNQISLQLGFLTAARSGFRLQPSTGLHFQSGWGNKSDQTVYLKLKWSKPKKSDSSPNRTRSEVSETKGSYEEIRNEPRPPTPPEKKEGLQQKIKTNPGSQKCVVFPLGFFHWVLGRLQRNEKFERTTNEQLLIARLGSFSLGFPSKPTNPKHGVMGASNESETNEQQAARSRRPARSWPGVAAPPWTFGLGPSWPPAAPRGSTPSAVGRRMVEARGVGGLRGGVGAGS